MTNAAGRVGDCNDQPLHYAIRTRHFDLVRLLLEHGARWQAPEVRAMVMHVRMVASAEPWINTARHQHSRCCCINAVCDVLPVRSNTAMDVEGSDAGGRELFNDSQSRRGSSRVAPAHRMKPFQWVGVEAFLPRPQQAQRRVVVSDTGILRLLIAAGGRGEELCDNHVRLPCAVVICPSAPSPAQRELVSTIGLACVCCAADTFAQRTRPCSWRTMRMTPTW